MVTFTRPLYISVRRHPTGALPLAHNAAMRATHHVYVIELSKDVLDDAKFMKSNPGYEPGMPCVYVGMTGLDPDVRFDNHKAGIRANKYANWLVGVYEKKGKIVHKDNSYFFEEIK